MHSMSFIETDASTYRINSKSTLFMEEELTINRHKHEY